MTPNDLDPRPPESSVLLILATLAGCIVYMVIGALK